jgi:hypothetical protein
MWRAVSLLAAAIPLIAACASTAVTPPASSPAPSPASAAPSPSAAGCTTLEDYARASLQPSATPAPPSFEPVAPDATPSTGLLALGETGILAAADGFPGMLVRVSNARFCDRLPAYRPSIFFPGTVLLADVEVQGLRSGVIPGFISAGNEPIAARYADATEGTPDPMHFGLPGARLYSRLDPGPGFGYSGLMAWEIPAGDGRVTVDVRQPSRAGDPSPPTVFAFLVRDGAVGWSPGSPEPTTDPAATPTMGEADLGGSVVLAAEGGTVPVVIDGVDQVPRYPGVSPTVGDAYLEARLAFGPGSGTFSFDPAEWVVVGPAGTALPQLHLADDGNLPPGWPNIATVPAVHTISPDWPENPSYIITEVSASGRITLEYRPAGRPAVVRWVLREE